MAAPRPVERAKPTPIKEYVIGGLQPLEFIVRTKFDKTSIHENLATYTKQLDNWLASNYLTLHAVVPDVKKLLKMYLEFIDAHHLELADEITASHFKDYAFASTDPKITSLAMHPSDNGFRTLIKWGQGNYIVTLLITDLQVFDGLSTRKLR